MTDEFVKVPYKREQDGSHTLFLPDCRMLNGYEIGQRDGDKERHIQNYWDALEKLQKMNQPRFRRRNKKGKFGTVTCEFGDFELVSKQLIEEMRSKYGG